MVITYKYRDKMLKKQMLTQGTFFCLGVVGMHVSFWVSNR